VSTATGAEVRAGHVVVATQGRSLRAAPWDGDELLIVGGESHELGDGDPSEKFEALARYARARFGAQSFEHRWSAHDFMPDDGLPYVGRLWPLSDRMLTATGMGKWGLAMGVAAGRLLADQVGGRPNVWAETFDPRRLPPMSAVPRLGKLGAKSGYHLVADRLRHGGSVADLGPGEGRVIRDGLIQKAVHRDSDGVLHAVSARCTHLGCIVGWNAAEGTWDCPCHGSRFEAGGEVANGPATQPLHSVRPPETKEEEEQMPPRGVKKGTKRARQYEKIKKSQKQQGRSEGRAEEIAARTVNKEKARKGESRTASRSSTKDISSGRRGGKRSGSSKTPRGRTREQLYNEAAKLNIAGRSKMNKKQLQAAINRKKGS
jgi:nitrite reductase/ring-hydroxylating ferredoxin subunit